MEHTPEPSPTPKEQFEKIATHFVSVTSGELAIGIKVRSLPEIKSIQREMITVQYFKNPPGIVVQIELPPGHITPLQ